MSYNDDTPLNNVYKKIGCLGQDIVRMQLERYAGITTQKQEYLVPDYKILENEQLVGYAEVKVQRRFCTNGNILLPTYSFPTYQINAYKQYDSPATPVELHIVDPSTGYVLWDFLSQLQKQTMIAGQIFPYDAYVQIFNGDGTYFHVKQFRYDYPAPPDKLKEILKLQDEAVQLKNDNDATNPPNFSQRFQSTCSRSIVNTNASTNNNYDDDPPF